MSDLSNLISKARKKFRLLGLVAITMTSSKIIQEEYQGGITFSEIDSLNKNHFFHIGSCSKSILSLVAAKFVEQKLVHWNTKFFDLYQDMKSGALVEYHSITLENLLACRAGIQAWTENWESLEKFETNSENGKFIFAQIILSQPPASEFLNGEFQFLYSNASYSLASLMLEKICNQDYINLIYEYIVEALNFEVCLGFPNKIDSNQPWGHSISESGIQVFLPKDEYKVPDILMPAGDLSMTPKDFAKYVQLHLKGLRGENNYISSDSYKYLHYRHKGFSLGNVNEAIKGLEYIAFDGSAGTFYCRAILIPQKDFAFIIMTNAGTKNGYLKAIDWLSLKITKNHLNWWWKIWT